MPRIPRSGPLLPDGRYSKSAYYKPKRDYNKGVSKPVKKFVKKEVNKSRWSDAQYASADLDFTVNPDNVINIYETMMASIFANDGEIIKNGQSTRDPDSGDLNYQLDIKIIGITLYLRYTNGESESLSAVSQHIREFLFRSRFTYQEILPGWASPITDIDACPNRLYMSNNTSALIHDKSLYVTNHAADGDTTVGGNAYTHKYFALGYTDRLTAPKADLGQVDTDKGVVLMNFKSENPDGTNTQCYGYYEVVWKYQV